MAENRGKQFENVIKEAFEKVPNTAVIRLHDQTTGFIGSVNPCDFIIFHEPYFLAIECKSVHGNTFPLSNITDNQWRELIKLSKIKGVKAGIICWWVDKDVTKFIPIQLLEAERQFGSKSIRYDYNLAYCDKSTGKISSSINISGKKKRVFFDYDMEEFFNGL